MADDQKDPTEREREDEDLEMDEEQAEDVKGGLDLTSAFQSTSGSGMTTTSSGLAGAPTRPTSTTPTTTSPTTNKLG